MFSHQKKSQNVTKLKKINILQKSKTQNMIEHKNYHCDKTQNVTRLKM